MPNVRIKLPAEGDVTVSYAGDEPVTYRAKDGAVSVPEEHAQDFLNAVQGSTVVGGTAPATKE